MDAKQYIDNLRRICSTNFFCDNCDFKKNGACPLDKTFLLSTPSEDIIYSIEQWNKDHPSEYQAYKAGVEYVRSLIEDAPAINPESMRPEEEWISVKDRLPDPYEKVLVRLDHWAGVDTYLAFYDTERGWCDYGGYFDDGTNNDGEPLTYKTAGVNVTHWMSLPKFPEEEGYYV